MDVVKVDGREIISIFSSSDALNLFYDVAFVI